MAGDWIKMRPSLLTHPKVNGIARVLEESREVGSALTTGFSGCMSEVVKRNVMRNVTVAALLVIWGAANEHTSDGVFRNADLADVDDMVGIPGFGEAMCVVGWAEFDADEYTVTLPNFNEYNTCGKDRTAEQNAERQRRHREKKKAESNAESNVTNNVTNNAREEKRREEVLEGKQQRATRLPSDWMPGESDFDFAAKERPDLNPEAVAQRFRDYWHGIAGQKGTKLDWSATWRNWVRNEKSVPGMASSKPRGLVL